MLKLCSYIILLASFTSFEGVAKAQTCVVENLPIKWAFAAPPFAMDAHTVIFKMDGSALITFRFHNWATVAVDAVAFAIEYLDRDEEFLFDTSVGALTSRQSVAALNQNFALQVTQDWRSAVDPNKSVLIGNRLVSIRTRACPASPKVTFATLHFVDGDSSQIRRSEFYRKFSIEEPLLLQPERNGGSQ